MPTYKVVVSLIFTVFLSGCATIILGNGDVVNPPRPDPIKFGNPICLDLQFLDGEGKRAQSTFYNEVAFSSYYNIFSKCENPKAQFQVVSDSVIEKKWWSYPWQAISVITIGIVPYYEVLNGTVTVEQNGAVVASDSFVEKRVSSIFLIPSWLYDRMRTVEVYRVDTPHAVEARRAAALIKKVQPKEK